MPISTDFFHGLVVMNLLFVCAAWSVARPSVRSSVALCVVAAAWLLFNGPIEGRILVSFSLQHGVTESDLLSVAAALIAVVGVWRARRTRSR